MQLRYQNLALARRSAARLVKMLNSGVVTFPGEAPGEALAKEITAFVLGYPTWNELRLTRHQGSSSPPDERLTSLDDLQARHAYQTSRLQEIRPHLADAQARHFIEQWRPSSATAFWPQPELEAPDSAGADAAFWESAPVEPRYALEILQTLQWPILGLAYNPGDATAVPAVLVSSEPRGPVPVLISAHEYDPGSDEDEHVRRQKAMATSFMQQHRRPAGLVLLFARPVRCASHLFLGSVYYQGRWLDMPWSRALASVDDLFRWTSSGWDIHNARAETADARGELTRLAYAAWAKGPGGTRSLETCTTLKWDTKPV
ncbi:hypothetical protein SAMN02787142_0619 [Burkholderia sp. WP9]|uniref:hypothetical protein n=1 Tax=Burkholderia sp. WP9 TaxID=1500263 RepID=UPI0008963AA4|nr:hypothetical protein [Burkholderia sp. WP9]SEB95268.1 hypothetical protein SAMN02787142_0619 [Burkholderia sp. WP9]